ncbi:hypothetical protein [Maribellus sediminis]|uniref:hypothetical protein n=1 Tax=Maribellus sediminis TaxID=2696285 RepID=UPI001431EF8F|nr:hypothetical protein [Maribellus sediminis]
MKKKSLKPKNLDKPSDPSNKNPESDDQEILMFIDKRKAENKALKKILTNLNSKGNNKKDN